MTISQILLSYTRTVNPKKQIRMVRIYSQQSKNTFKKLLTDVNWDAELKHKNVNEAMLAFNQKITIAYNQSFPFKRLSRKRAKDKPWITTGLKESIQQKHLLFKSLFLIDLKKIK